MTRLTQSTIQCGYIIFNLVNEKTYHYHELESMAQPYWRVSPYKIFKRARLRDLLFSPDNWQWTAIWVVERLASLILTHEHKMKVVWQAHIRLSTREQKRLLKKVGLTSTISELQKAYGENHRVISYHRAIETFTRTGILPLNYYIKVGVIQETDEAYLLWSILQEKQREYRNLVNERVWRKFYNQYVKNQQRIHDATPSELEILQSYAIDQPVDLLAFTTHDSKLTRPFYFIEVKATKKKQSFQITGSERVFIVNNMDKAKILIMYFTFEPEYIKLKYFKPTSVINPL